MAASAKIIGADKVKRKLRHIPGAVEANLRETLFQAANEIKAAAIAEIEKPKHGRLYTRPNRWKSATRTWHASAPGEAPAKKSGQRMSQIAVKKANRKLKPQSRIKAPGIYRLLEAGMQRIAPRPLFGPLMKRKGPEVMRAVRAATQKTVKAQARR